ncbi:N-acetylmuramoyl-L-alanine amidase-like domain-containing protein [Cellulophaga sp. Z1A5H]|uniref:N-acetylmuramoyl-L-alanine amidase-like domain-containing protein n=1 Tax=Cellulophaga sp. Z1A5H TaxID=2687291 RepID=UPI0013FDA1D7|nr:N-acetylmuramoyl-L-alanine amidase-like domain-containing protein [Cellulophaga sp. Z1A5H]
MKILFLTALLFINFSFAQQITCSPQNKEAFEVKIKEIKSLKKDDIGASMAAIGKTFLGIPYVAKTLEIGTTETLVVDLEGLDCTTFVENVLAFSLLKKSDSTTFNNFTKKLETIRYKNGSLNGYNSRLHYFTEWIANNQFKGLITDITAKIGGTPIQKEINFMSTHRTLYPFLKDDDANLEKIKASEDYLNTQEFCILEKDNIAANEHLIQTGDIIALTTSIKGLDITHTGIATREQDGRIHLLHASTSGAVKISEKPLVDYLKGIKSNTGIMVVRVN